MKKNIINEIYRMIKADPKLKRKVKIFAIVGIVCFMIVGTLTIWAGISAFNYIASNASNAVHSPVAQNNIEGIKTELKKMPTLQPLSCWGKAQSLMAVEPWLARPAMENLNNLKLACLKNKPIVCEGVKCTNQNVINQNVEGRTI